MGCTRDAGGLGQVTIPADQLAEAGALACVMQSDGKGRGLLKQLRRTDFNDIRHETVFRALLFLDADGKTLDTISVYQHLRDKGQLEAAGGNYVLEIVDKSPSADNFPTFLESVRDQAFRREAYLLATDSARSSETLRQLASERVTKRPAVTDAAQFAAESFPEPSQLIGGILHKGCKMALGGGSKTSKTWNLIDLALSISHGEPWLSFKTIRARVCYVNLELPDWSFHSRLRVVAREKQIEIEPGWLHVWNLRGHSTAYAEMLPELAAELRQHELGLLIIDPIYRLYGDADENNARDIANLLNQFEHLARDTGAAIAFAAHFSKGNQAGKESVDRISGSGVFARDPDAILTFTRHETEGAFTVDSTLRNCSSVDPFVVRWQYPLMRRCDDLDPAKLKQIKGRPATHKPADLLPHLTKRKITTDEWQKKVSAENGMSRRTFYDLLKDVRGHAEVKQTKAGKWFRDANANEPF